jgi:hypothetical protein
MNYGSVTLDDMRATSCPIDDALRNGSRQKEKREHL